MIFRVLIGNNHREELESIYVIKNGNVLSVLRTSLRIDLIIALLFSVGFIITLQWLDLSTSNFWSLIMGFIAMQHIIIFILQSYLIQKSNQLNDNVIESVKESIKKLKVLRWYYRILPVILTITLVITYYLLFGIPLGWSGLIASGIGISLLVLAISEFLSSKIVRSRINELEGLRKDFSCKA